MKAADTRVRFEPRQIDKEWRVYDRTTASYPYRTPELGIVAQGLATKEAAQTEADRLQAHLLEKSQTENSKNSKNSKVAERAQDESPKLGSDSEE